MSPVRVFVAVSISEEARAAIASMIEELKGLDAKIRWVPPRNMHLTLKFVGDIDEQMVPELQNELSHSTEGMSPFNYELTDKGCFPSWNQPRILWVDLRDPEGRLVSLHKEIDRRFQPFGVRGEKRRFKPHLTIGRVKPGSKPETAISAFRQFPLGEYRVDVREVHLMRSKLHPSGAKYSVLYSAPLGHPYAETVHE